MCLNIRFGNHLDTQNLEKHPKIKNAFIVYKRLKINDFDKTLYSPIYNDSLKKDRRKFKNRWVVGRTYKSNRPNKELTRNERSSWTVNKGIHVYTRISPDQIYDSCVMVKCIALQSDFVAVSCYNEEAVFMKVKPIKRLSIKEVRKIYDKQNSVRQID